MKILDVKIDREKMLTTTDKTRHFNHIIWQPTFSCSATCKSCYVKAGPLGNREAAFSPELFRLLFTVRTIDCDQLTLSMDNTLDPNEGFCSILKLILKLYRPDTEYVYQLPQLCMTFKSWNSVAIWCRALKIQARELLAPVDILSLSTFPTLGKVCEEVVDICRETSTTLNYNCMVKEDTVKSKSFEIGTRYSNMVYMVLRKSPLGMCSNKEDLILYHDAVCETTSTSLKVDQCVSATNLRAAEGTTCSAGIGIVSVWPGDRVTGCPYDSHGHGESQGDTLVERMIKVSNPMDQHCKLGDLYAT